MRRVTKNSIEKGKITLAIPPAYRETAKIVDSEAQRLGKSFSTLIWELVDEFVREQQELPLPKLNVKSKAFRREDLYEELLDKKIK